MIQGSMLCYFEAADWSFPRITQLPTLGAPLVRVSFSLNGAQATTTPCRFAGDRFASLENKSQMSLNTILESQLDWRAPGSALSTCLFYSALSTHKNDAEWRLLPSHYLLENSRQDEAGPKLDACGVIQKIGNICKASLSSSCFLVPFMYIYSTQLTYIYYHIFYVHYYNHIELNQYKCRW